jgi:hypothetical protein
VNPEPVDLLAVLAHERDALDAERRRLARAHCLAVLDYIAVKIRSVSPDAVYVAFTYDGRLREPYVQGILGAQPSPLGACPWLWDGSDEDHPLNELFDEIERAVQTALEPPHSLAWASVVPDTAGEGKRRLLELPPPSRIGRIAELVHKFHPAATALVVDGQAGGRVIEIIEGAGGDGTERRTTGRIWGSERNREIRRLVCEVFALPYLAEGCLEPVANGYTRPDSRTISDLVCVLPLPPTA